jgi:hypothetical protein
MSKVLTTIFLVLSLLKLMVDLPLFAVLKVAYWDYSSLLFLLIAMALPIGAALFYKEKAVGWKVMVTYFSLVTIAILLYYINPTSLNSDLNSNNPILFHFVYSTSFAVDLTPISRSMHFLVPFQSDPFIITMLIVSLVLLGLLFTKHVKESFKITKRASLLTLTVGILISLSVCLM